MVDLTGQLSNPVASLNATLAALKPIKRTKPTPTVHQIQRRLGPDGVRNLIAKYKAGVTQPVLAREFEVSRDTVHEILKRRNVQRRLVGLSDEGAAEAIKLYAKGWSAARIGNHLGVDGKTVWRSLRRAGVETRPRSGGAVNG